jgi:hypothetical protein
MTDDPRVGGTPGDEPVHEDVDAGESAAGGPSGDEAHDQERKTAEGWRGASESSEASEEVTEGLERAQEQPGFGREGS